MAKNKKFQKRDKEAPVEVSGYQQGGRVGKIPSGKYALPAIREEERTYEPFRIPWEESKNPRNADVFPGEFRRKGRENPQRYGIPAIGEALKAPEYDPGVWEEGSSLPSKLRFGRDQLFPYGVNLYTGVPGYQRGGEVRPIHAVHNDLHQRMIANAARRDPQHATRLLQGLRREHNGMRAIATAALAHSHGLRTVGRHELAHGHDAQALHMLNMAHANVPDGAEVNFTQHGDHQFNANVKRNGRESNYPLTRDQMLQWAIGPAGGFDHSIINGPEKNLNILTRPRMGPVRGYQGGGVVADPYGYSDLGGMFNPNQGQDPDTQAVRQVLDETHRDYMPAVQTQDIGGAERVGRAPGAALEEQLGGIRRAGEYLFGARTPAERVPRRTGSLRELLHPDTTNSAGPDEMQRARDEASTPRDISYGPEALVRPSGTATEPMTTGRAAEPERDYYSTPVLTGEGALVRGPVQGPPQPIYDPEDITNRRGGTWEKLHGGRPDTGIDMGPVPVNPYTEQIFKEFPPDHPFWQGRKGYGGRGPDPLLSTTASTNPRLRDLAIKEEEWNRENSQLVPSRLVAPQEPGEKPAIGSPAATAQGEPTDPTLAAFWRMSPSMQQTMLRDPDVGPLYRHAMERRALETAPREDPALAVLMRQFGPEAGMREYRERGLYRRPEPVETTGGVPKGASVGPTIEDYRAGRVPGYDVNAQPLTGYPTAEIPAGYQTQPGWARLGEMWQRGRMLDPRAPEAVRGQQIEEPDFIKQIQTQARAKGTAEWDRVANALESYIPAAQRGGIGLAPGNQAYLMQLYKALNPETLAERYLPGALGGGPRVMPDVVPTRITTVDPAIIQEAQRQYPNDPRAREAFINANWNRTTPEFQAQREARQAGQDLLTKANEMFARADQIGQQRGGAGQATQLTRTASNLLMQHFGIQPSPKGARAPVGLSDEKLVQTYNTALAIYERAKRNNVPDYEQFKPSAEFKEQYDKATKGGAPTGGGPKAGDVVKGYRFRGGNPADENNWEKV